jgi:hypothetical protein
MLGQHDMSPPSSGTARGAALMFASCARKIASRSVRATRTPLADRVRVFARERENVGQKCPGRPCGGAAALPRLPAARQGGLVPHALVGSCAR